jgi:hypothetical protein
MYGTIITLRQRGVEVLTMKLHDPNRKIRLPKRLARLLHQRVETLNHIIDDVSQLLGAQCLDVRKIDHAYDQRIWHIDRMHPNRTGYHLLASHFARLLHVQGHDVRDVTAPLVRPRSRKENARWMLRMGLPWFLKRCKDLFPGVGYLLVLETSKDVMRALRKQRRPLRQAALPTGYSERRFAHLDTSTEHRRGVETNVANRPSQAAA